MTTEPGRTLARHLHIVPINVMDLGDCIYICSCIHRAAVTYARIQEVWCNEELSDRMTAYYEKREAQLEALITRHCNKLTALTGHEYIPEFGGDPRGFTVKIGSPGVQLGNQDWGLDGKTGVA